MWHFVGVFPHEHAQCETWINYRISRSNFIADWTTVLWKISIAGLTIAGLLEHSHHPGPDFIFPKQSIGGKMSLRDFSNTLGFQSGLFFTTIRLRTQFSATLT